MKENKTQTEIHTGTILLKVTFSSEMCKRILHIIICFTSGGKKVLMAIVISNCWAINLLEYSTSLHLCSLV